MAAFRFALTRRSLIEETFWVEADTPEEAVDRAGNGEYDDNNITQVWSDWYDDYFEISQDFEPEPLCPLHKMVKEYNPTDSKVSEQIG